MQAKILWVTDPWETLDHINDTTLRLMQDAQQQGAINYWSEYQAIHFRYTKVILVGKQLLSVAEQRTSMDFEFGPSTILSPDEFHFIHYRVDPPVNDTYRYYLQLLFMQISYSERRNPFATQIINPPPELFATSEKFGQAVIGELMPLSLVSSQWRELLVFGQDEKRTVVKPLNTAQNKGVELLQWDRENDGKNRLFLQEMTNNFTVPILMQRYLEDVKNGEIRLWFINGNLLAVARKVPKRDSFLISIDHGDVIVETELDANESKIANRIGEHLKKKGIVLAAVDMIDKKVTDYNITSPGLLVQIEKLLNRNLAGIINTEIFKLIN